MERTKDEWLHYLESTHPADIEMGLGRVTKVAQSLALFKPASTVIVVGGTNGKGTTTALLGQLLAEKGLSSACYNSPHIHQYNERINQRSASGEFRLSSDEELCEAFAAIEEGRGDIPLTYFEFGTLAALWQIKQWRVDVAILEVGLGGRLDAVNIVDTDLAIVTSVGLDHQDWLGDTLDLIGHEKAGIGRAHKPLICGQPSVSQGFLQHAHALNADLIRIDEHYSITPHTTKSIRAGWQLTLQPHAEKPAMTLELPQGHIPYFNIASAIIGLNAVDLLPSDEAISRAVENTHVAGRLTRYSCLYQDKTIDFMLDVAHNPQAAAFVASQITHCQHAILAVLKDKDPRGIVDSIPQIKHWHLAGLGGYRGQTVGALQSQLIEPFSQDSNKNIASIDINIEQAMSHCLSIINDQQTVLVIGSFLTVSAAEAFILSHPDLEVVRHGR